MCSDIKKRGTIQFFLNLLCLALAICVSGHKENSYSIVFIKPVMFGSGSMCPDIKKIGTVQFPLNQLCSALAVFVFGKQEQYSFY